MSTLGDLTGPLVPAVVGADRVLASTLAGSPAPVPTVRTGPRRITAPRGWSAPAADGGGQVTVHRDVLRDVAARMRSDLRDIDEAVRRLSGARHGGGVSISGSGGAAGWDTAAAFNANASSAYAGVLRATQQAGNTHQDTSRKLADSASAYDDSEADNVRAIRGVSSVGTYLNAVTGMVASYGHRGVAAASAGVQRYTVKTRAVAPFSGAGMSAAEIMSILHGLDPGAVQESGASHTALGNTLNAVAGRLAGNAHTLAQNWSGTAAQGAMGQFQRLHDHMVTLAADALQVGSVLTWLGNDVLPQFKTLPDPSVSAMSLTLSGAVSGGEIGGTLAGPAGGAAGEVVGAVMGAADSLFGNAQAAADKKARQYIAKLSGYLVTANAALPATIGGVPGSGGASGPGKRVAVPAAGAPSGGAGSGVPAGGAGAGVPALTTSAGGASAGRGAPGVTVGAVGGGIPGAVARLQSASGGPPGSSAGDTGGSSAPGAGDVGGGNLPGPAGGTGGASLTGPAGGLTGPAGGLGSGESLAGPPPGGVPGEPEPPVSELPFAGPGSAGAGPAGVQRRRVRPRSGRRGTARRRRGGRPRPGRRAVRGGGGRAADAGRERDGLRRRGQRGG